FQVPVDFSRDQTGFFADPHDRAIVQQAADDWAYYLDDMRLLEVPASDEMTWIWDPDGFVSGADTMNQQAYHNFLLYAYGIHSSALRSGGEGSYHGGFQSDGTQSFPLRRSGGLEVETAGNFNTLGWFLTNGPDDWW